MKTLIYYLLLLVAIALVTGFILSGASTMAMPQIIGISGALVLYTVALSFVGEGTPEDERALTHRHLANRAGLIAGTVVLCLGILFQLFTRHTVDYWLMTGLISINLTKIISLIWLNYKK
ncbi:MAG: hypothetical protein KBD66_03380 [Candidatus Doudnabacteria bacterium]|nr:hypothetical protein [Candidatus Doudnabacteria bacterium]